MPTATTTPPPEPRTCQSGRCLRTATVTLTWPKNGPETPPAIKYLCGSHYTADYEGRIGERVTVTFIPPRVP